MFIKCLVCDKESGVCLECYLGWYGSECIEYCLFECCNGCFINNGSCENKVVIIFLFKISDILKFKNGKMCWFLFLK